MAKGPEYQKRWYKERRAKGLCCACDEPAVAGKAHCEYHAKAMSRNARKRKYGLTEEQLCALESITECAICGGPAEHIDHDHETGAIRGVLCLNCNAVLGHAHDDVNVLAKAIAYLSENS